MRGKGEIVNRRRENGEKKREEREKRKEKGNRT
jgi:hypothetical protein